MIDFYVGQLIFICVYFGMLKKGDVVWNLVKGKKECIGCIVLMQVNDCYEVDELYVGDIVVCVGLKDVIIGDMLCDLDVVIIFEWMEFLELVILLVIELKIKVDQEKMGIVLQWLVVEDLLFCLYIDEEFGQMIIFGMGELYLEIIVDWMKCEFGVEVNIGCLQVIYCEILCKKVMDVEGKFVCQFGGKGQYGYVVLILELLELGSGFVFEDVIKGGVVLCEYIFFVEKGLCEVMGIGVLVGYLVVDVKVILIFGLYYDVDFLEMVFCMVVIFGFWEGVCKVDLVIFELVMYVEVEMLEEYVGNIMGDFFFCCGMVQGMEECFGSQIICVDVLLVEMFGYFIMLCLMLQGWVIYSMEFYYYVEVLCNVVDEIIVSCVKS